MKRRRKTRKILVGVFTAAILLTVVNLTEGAVSDDDNEALLNAEAELNHTMTGPSHGVTVTSSFVATMDPADFDDPLMFDFSDLSPSTKLGSAYPNPDKPEPYRPVTSKS